MRGAWRSTVHARGRGDDGESELTLRSFVFWWRCYYFSTARMLPHAWMYSSSCIPTLLLHSCCSPPLVRALKRTMPFTMAMYYPAEFCTNAGWHMPGILCDPPLLLPLPPLLPLSPAHWPLHLVTAVPSRIGARLLNSLLCSVLCSADSTYFVMCDIIVQAERC
jgi:hypothetical protein